MGNSSNGLTAVVIVRHGETEWSRESRHTGRTDVDLDDAGRQEARDLRNVLGGWTFSAVYTSTLARARETAALAGYAGRSVALDDLVEWDYGDYEGLTTPQIRERRPGWTLWRDGVPGGETIDDVSARADRVLTTMRANAGDVLVVAHGHLLRVLTARWLNMAPTAGAHFFLGTATPSVLGYEHDWAVIRRWNIAPA